MQWDESDYRRVVQGVLTRIEKAFEAVDPDVADCEQSLGSLSITLADGSRLILSSQPSVRQIWLALASRGTAYHFNFDAKTSVWMDDKGRGVELFGFLSQYFRETCQLDLRF